MCPILPVSLGCPFFFLFVFVLCLVPNIACVSGLSILFFICLRPVSCAQYCLCLWVVHFFLFVFVLCLVPNIACVSGLSILCFICPRPVSCAQYCLCLWVVHSLFYLSSSCVLYPILPVSLGCPFFVLFVFVLCLVLNIACVSGLSILFLFVFVLCLVPNIACVSGLSILYFICLRSVSCAYYCLCLWVVHSLFYLSSSCVLCLILPVSLGCPFFVLFVFVPCLVPNIACVSGLSILCFICLRPVLCTQYCLCLWVVHSLFYLSSSSVLGLILPVSLGCPFFFYLSSSCVLCPILPVSLGCPFFFLFVFVLCLVPNIACVSGLSILYFICLRSVSCAHYCLCLWVVHSLFYLSSSCVLCPILPVSLGCPFFFLFVFVLCLVPNIACVSGLSILFFICLRPVSCAQYCLCLWVVHFFLFVFVLCLVPNIACVSGLSILCFICPRPVSCAQYCLCLWVVHSLFYLSSSCVLYPILPVSLGCPFFVLFVFVLCLVLNIACVSGLSILFLFVFVLCLVPNIACVSGLSILYFICLRSVSCAYYCLCLWVVHSLFYLSSSCVLCLILPVSLGCPFFVLFVFVPCLVPNIACVSGLSILCFICLRPVLCTQYCLCLWVVHSLFYLSSSSVLGLILPVSLGCPFFFYLSSSCVLCPILPVSLGCPFFFLFVFVLCLVPNIACVSGLSILYFICLRSVSCAHYCLCLWVVHSLCYLSSSCVLCLILPVSLGCPFFVLFVFVLCLVPNIACVSGLSILFFICLRPVSCTQYCLFLWVVHSLFYLSSSSVLCLILPVSLGCPFFVLFVFLFCLVLNIACVSGLSICFFICLRPVSCTQYCLCLWVVDSLLYLSSSSVLCPILSVSLGCPFFYLFIFVLCLRVVHSFFYLSSSCVLCPILPASLVCPFFFYLSSSCVLCPILPVSLGCPFFVLFVFLLCLVLNIACVSGLSILCFICLRPVSCA